MKIGLTTIAYNEQRLIKPFLKHIPDWVDEVLVLVSSKPWQGEDDGSDRTASIARHHGATVIEHDWPNETEQRNAGQDYFNDMDYIVVLDPDEFLDSKGWDCVRHVLSTEDAFVVAHQRVFYKDKEVYPHTDYQQIILVKPTVRFVENRVIDRGYATLPIDLYHFSWARTNDEIWSKISHYAHAEDFDKLRWYNDVWLANQQTNLHPKTPETLQALIEPILPKEIERLKLWP